MMQSSLENNVLALSVGIAVAAVLFVLAGRIESTRLRRAVRTSLVFLALPVTYVGHPFLFYQSWMFPVVFIESQNLGALSVYLAIWLALVGMFQLGLSKK